MRMRGTSTRHPQVLASEGIPVVPIKGVHGTVDFPLLGIGTWQYNTSVAKDRAGLSSGFCKCKSYERHEAAFCRVASGLQGVVSCSYIGIGSA